VNPGASGVSVEIRPAAKLASMLLSLLLFCATTVVESSETAQRGEVARAASDPTTVTVLRVRADIYMLTVNGVNVTLATGPEGAVLVDTGPASGSKALLAAIQKVAATPIRYLIDSSGDADLIGGNGTLAAAGQSLVRSAASGGTTSAAIVARSDLLDRMIAQPADFPDSPQPGEIFTRPQYNFALNGQGIAAVWEPAAHSDVDIVVRFWGSDVVATGDLFDITRFPEIDLQHGGSIHGEIDALNGIINTLVIAPTPLVRNTGGTLVVPVRGPLCDQADLVTYRDMVIDVRDRIEQLLEQGRNLQQIQSMDVTQGYDSRFGADTGSWTTAQFVEAVYKSLVAEKKAKGRHAKEGAR
jgi:glyoxylase-like metal-dependent hydrolase (beta-lactamase superfamily II)